MDLTRRYPELVKEIDALTPDEKKLWIQAIWDQFIPLSTKLTEILNEKKSTGNNTWNVYNSLFFLIGPIPWFIERFGKSPAALQLTQPQHYRRIFRILTEQHDNISPSLLQSFKTAHKHLLLLQQLYSISDFDPVPSELVRAQMLQDVYFQNNPHTIDAYIETHEQEVAKREEENSRYITYLSEL